MSVESPVAQQSVSAVRLTTDSTSWTRRWQGLLLLWAGWLIPQFILLGPALIGRTVDIPVDLLVPHPFGNWSEKLYLPETKENASIAMRHGNELGDLVVQFPPAREFFSRELRAGRLPMWNPDNLGGVPIVGWGYSPFEVPYYVFPSPVTVAWISLLQSLTIGLGVWLFLRRSLDLSYPAAALASWCAPLTGFMTLWHGFSTLAAACWLPWLLLAIDASVKRPRGWGFVSTALVTTLVLLGGHFGLAGLVLLTSGFYAVWRLVEAAWAKEWRRVACAAPVITAGWLLGFAISAVVLLPFLDYVATGARTDSQLEGREERPPQGLEALPAIMRPDVYGGGTRFNWTNTASVPLIESSSCAYAGLLAALWLAPLAWSHRTLRRQTVFWTLIVVVTVGWTLNIPGIVDLLRSRPLRPLAPLSYNRWTFATSEAILILAAIGLDSLSRGLPRFRWWWGLPIVATGVFFCWCVARLFSVTRELEKEGFSNYLLIGAGLSLVVLVAWILTFRAGPGARWTRLALIALLPLELFGFAWDERRQADRSLYFPRVAVLEKLAALPQGRVWGVGCLAPNLNLMCGLEDVRGYDAVDPLAYLKLFQLACDKESSVHYPECRTIMAKPAGNFDAHGLKLHPVADLLNVRYLIFRDPPRSGLPVLLHEDDYWIIENQNVLPRAYVPTAAQVVKSDAEALERMAGFDFDPRKTVLMTDDLSLPSTMKGTAGVRYETPTRISLEVEMQTPGLVLLSNRWDPGWSAQIDGSASPIYCVDYALRGFRVPAGKHTIVSTYSPPNLRKGLAITTTGFAGLLLWVIWQFMSRRRASLAAERR
ncbi:MAG TPA: YfhO family protein [Planctomycetaceae bacterium]|nr:YfhO family protein [Planctomycetaceae bacterium]